MALKPLIALLLVVAAALAAAAASARPQVNGKLAFRRYLDPTRTWGAVFTINPDGTGLRQVTHPPRGVSDVKPDWSPDGRAIAFVRITANGCGNGCETDEIVVVRSDGASPRRVAFDPPGKGCHAGGVCRGIAAWSPDGKRLAFACDDKICITDADGSALHRLPQDQPGGLVDGNPAWSPDGKLIAFNRAVRTEHAVFVARADGTEARQVTPWRLDGAQPDWSPDGTRLVFYSNFDGPSRVSANLYTVAPDGTKLHALTRARGGKTQYLSASFSPDGRWLAFSRVPGVGGANADVFVMRVDGTHIRNVTRSPAWDSGVDWGVRLP
jgi:Tol biopolymer transport system component